LTNRTSSANKNINTTHSTDMQTRPLIWSDANVPRYYINKTAATCSTHYRSVSRKQQQQQSSKVDKVWCFKFHLPLLQLHFDPTN